jgi:predicted nucleic acid-binding protein
VVLIDSDVLLLAFSYQHDERQAANAAFLARAQELQLAITVYNLMEILGKLSFNLSPTRLDNWQSWLVDAYHLVVIWPETFTDQDAESFFRQEIVDRPFAKFRAQRMAFFMDALILNLAERASEIEHFVTWNARHFKNKSSLSVITPSEYLTRVR